MKCHLCKDKPCGEGNPCEKTDSIPLYDDPLDRKLFKVAADVEALFYKEACRIDETMEFARRMGFRRLGIAFCVGFKAEAAILGEILSKEFEVFSTCCKVGSVEKATFGMAERPWIGKVSCNPIEQARILAEEGTEFNIVLGLCVGHDSLFYKHSKAPVTTLVVKDRKLGHNPVAALYCPYIRSELGRPLKERPLEGSDAAAIVDQPRE
ncbi:MAG: DUF1847 domain-containing protein [Thermovirgaceae bacterium]|nr:DUF1847 domain-containing protein [Synergistales bacterium]